MARYIQSPNLGISSPVSFKLSGINTATIKLLRESGIQSVWDLLCTFPRTHLELIPCSIDEVEQGQNHAIIGRLESYEVRDSPRQSRLTIENWTIADQSGSILRASTFYNHSRYRTFEWRSQQQHQYQRGKMLLLMGKVKIDSRWGVQMSRPTVEIVDEDFDSNRAYQWQSLYSDRGALKGIKIAAAIATAWNWASEQDWEDKIPGGLNMPNDLSLKAAIRRIHFPMSQDQIDQARERLSFEEFFWLQVELLQRRQQRLKVRSQPTADSGELESQFYEQLPFSPTSAQTWAIREIRQDLQQSTPMERLLQGDVGSGKTVVAAAAIVIAVEAGWQTALMAPTEVLAKQLHDKLTGWLNPIGIKVGLLTGSTPAAARTRLFGQLISGELPVVVGTHALIEDTVSFKNLGLVIIDEQHRFGVDQRAQLNRKAPRNCIPHMLVMTATPIPRTLALTLHGEMDISTLAELPPGRQPITTCLIHTGDSESHMWQAVRVALEQGRQAYVILPLAEQSDTLNLRSAAERYQTLQCWFEGYEIGLLYGSMNPAQKQDTLEKFRLGEVHILVSTTVVEVGIDVPNASIIVIEHAERFGLAQLHQLRGRVGRGKHASTCYLATDSTADKAIERLSVLVESQDGFHIAEMDLRLRGPGEVIGNVQSGMPEFSIANWVEDGALLELARVAAEKAVSLDLV